MFTLEFGFALTPEAWTDDIGDRIPLLTHEKALIIQSTIVNEAAYEAGTHPNREQRIAVTGRVPSDSSRASRT